MNAPVISAGILLYRVRAGRCEVFLVHPGGPYWAKKDTGTWSVPKGIAGPGEDHLDAARREFREETGFDAKGRVHALGTFPQRSGKRLIVWAAEGDCDPARLASNMFEMEWPPRSGRLRRFPEADRGGWFGRSEALGKIVPGQRPILEALYDLAPWGTS
ncbi:MAG TPA: NUDIX domain-containing protein [Rhizomicrobium sp.]|nr:NUDIX domain-containing protein [Rhizomicrobium sp.]